MSSAAPARLGTLTYDVRARRYRRPNGRFLTEREMLGVLEGQIAETGARMRRIGQSLLDRQTSLADFQLQMADEVKALHHLAAAVEAGGFKQFSRADLEWASGQIREQLAFLLKFSREIRTGKQARDGRILARVDQYARAARGTRDRMMGRIMEARGYDEEAWELAPGDHCRTRGDIMGCVERARLGRGPINSRPGYGRCVCRNNCRCTRRLYRGGRAA